MFVARIGFGEITILSGMVVVMVIVGFGQGGGASVQSFVGERMHGSKSRHQQDEPCPKAAMSEKGSHRRKRIYTNRRSIIATPR